MPSSMGMSVRHSRVHDYPPRWNAAPSQELLVIRRNHKTGEVSLDPLRWGLIPYWCQDPTGGRRPINAKYETVWKLPTFHEAYRKRRCIVPVDGFFEWRAIMGQKAKQPYAIAMKDGASDLLPFGRIGKSRPQAIGSELSRSSLRMPTSWSRISMIGCPSSCCRPTMRGGLAKNPTLAT